MDVLLREPVPDLDALLATVAAGAGSQATDSRKRAREDDEEPTHEELIEYMQGQTRCSMRRSLSRRRSAN